MENTKKHATQSHRFRWPRWIQAERKVRQILDSLPMDHFIVMNDVRFKYGNIDHLVIRDDGRIFLIETKSHHGTVTFDGRQLLLNGKPFKANYIAQINRNIRWLRRMAEKTLGINPWYTAMIVFPNAQVAIKGWVKQVKILQETALIQYICHSK